MLSNAVTIYKGLETFDHKALAVKNWAVLLGPLTAFMNRHLYKYHKETRKVRQSAA